MFLLRSFAISSIRKATTCTSLRGLSTMCTLPRLPLFEAMAKHEPNTTAIAHSASGRTFSYGQLLQDVASEKQRLSDQAGSKSIEGSPVAFLVENSYDYVVTLLSIFGAHAIALPLSPPFPTKELQYIMHQSGAGFLLSSRRFEGKAREILHDEYPVMPRHIELEKKMEREQDATARITLEGNGESKGGLLLYTSGTTNRPKGVFLPQSALTAQSQSLRHAWQYDHRDHLLHVLPLHHIHGTVNALLTPLYSGATIEFLFPFNALNVWTRFAAPFLPSNSLPALNTPLRNKEIEKPITFFTVVPTIYARLLSTFPSIAGKIQGAAKQAITRPYLRLPISGSAALPLPVKNAWSDLSNGNNLLERYGMTEIGMALSCGLEEGSRVDGSVGFPLPGVEVKLVELETGRVIKDGEELDENGRERDGEIWIRGKGVFSGYWRDEKATERDFVDAQDGGERWFRTGDVAVRRHVPSAGVAQGPETDNPAGQEWAHGKMYFIRGRKSADIIKSGGEKVSALEVEREILSLQEIEEVAVVAIPSTTWGQKVGAAVVLSRQANPKESIEHSDKVDASNSEQDTHTIGAIVVLKPHTEGKRGGEGSWGAMDLRRALRERLAAYKIPRVVRVVEGIPKNAMGKINKKELVKTIFADDVSGDEM